MAHRIRYTMTQEPLSSKLEGIVEIDETWIDQKMRRGRTKEEKAANKRNKNANKASVVSVLQRNGNVYSRHVRHVTAANLRPMIDEMVHPEARVMTDSSTVLKGLLMDRQHDQVNHTKNEYVRYEDGVCITTNSVEGYFGLLKRGINGIYHHVGQQHLHRYLTEFDYRYNSRKETDSMRTVQALKSTTGKRLILRDSRRPNGIEGSF